MFDLTYGVSPTFQLKPVGDPKGVAILCRTSQSEKGDVTLGQHLAQDCYFPHSPENFGGFFLRIYMGIFNVELKNGGDFGWIILVSVSHETKHENSLNIQGKIGRNSGQRSGRNFEKFGKLSFCNFCDQRILEMGRVECRWPPEFDLTELWKPSYWFFPGSEQNAEFSRVLRILRFNLEY